MPSNQMRKTEIPDAIDAASLANEMAKKRTEMAAERTELSLIRTGLTASSFGAGLTQILGRGVWPSLAVDLLTIVFILAGAVSVQIGLIRLLKRHRATENKREASHSVRRLLVVGVSLLQFALIAIVLMVIIHM